MRSALPVIFIAALALIGCGGGSGGSSAPTPPPAPTPPATGSTTVAGAGVLGPVRNAVVEVRAADGETIIGSGTTDPDSGRFVGLTIPADSTGPVLVLVRGADDGSTVYACDNAAGCPSAAGTVAFADDVTVAAGKTLQYAVADAASLADSFLNVSPFSHLASLRAQADGGLTADSVLAAEAAITAAVASLLGTDVGDRVTALRLLDLVDAGNNADADSRDEATLMVSALGAALHGAAGGDGVVDIFDVLASLATDFAADGELAEAGTGITREDLLLAAADQLNALPATSAVVAAIVEANPDLDPAAAAAGLFERIASAGGAQAERLAAVAAVQEQLAEFGPTRTLVAALAEAVAALDVRLPQVRTLASAAEDAAADLAEREADYASLLAMLREQSNAETAIAAQAALDALEADLASTSADQLALNTLLAAVLADLVAAAENAGIDQSLVDAALRVIEALDESFALDAIASDIARLGDLATAIEQELLLVQNQVLDATTGADYAAARSALLALHPTTPGYTQLLLDLDAAAVAFVTAALDALEAGLTIELVAAAEQAVVALDANTDAGAAALARLEGLSRFFAAGPMVAAIAPNFVQPLAPESTAITVTFSKPVDPARTTMELGNGAFRGYPMDLAWSDNNTELTWFTGDTLRAGVRYDLYITAKDLQGRSLRIATEYQDSFAVAFPGETVDDTAPDTRNRVPVGVRGNDAVDTDAFNYAGDLIRPEEF